MKTKIRNRRRGEAYLSSRYARTSGRRSYVKQSIKGKSSRYGAISVAIVTLILTALSFIGISARAADDYIYADIDYGDQAFLSIDRALWYPTGTNNTSNFRIGSDSHISGAGNASPMGYCLNPSMSAPASGFYTAEDPSKYFSKSTIDDMRAVLWFSYNAPGFKKLVENNGLTAVWPEYDWFGRKFTTELTTTNNTTDEGGDAKFHTGKYDYVVDKSWSSGSYLQDNIKPDVAPEWTADAFMILTHAALSQLAGSSDWSDDLYAPSICQYSLPDMVNQIITNCRNMAKQPGYEVPDSFKCYYINMSHSAGVTDAFFKDPSSISRKTQALVGWSYKPAGGLELDKSLHCNFWSGNSNYAQNASGIQFRITGNGVNMTITTDSSGHAATASDALEEGMYTVTEVNPPKGFTFGGQTSWNVTVKSGEMTSVTYGDIVNYPKYGLPPSIQKLDSETGDESPQGSASFAGAIFEWTFTGGGVTRTWRTKTDASGYTTLDRAHLVSGTLWECDGQVVLPIGTLTAREVQAPSGYLVNNSDTFTWTISDNGSTTNRVLQLTGDQLDPTIPEEVIKGGLSVRKVDDDSGDYASQGDADITGVEFQVRNVSPHPVVVNGREYASGAVITDFAHMKVDSDGIATTGNDVLPYGDYEVSEVTEPNEGYHGTTTTFTVQIREARVYGPESYTFRNKVYRGGAKVQKIDFEFENIDELKDKTNYPQAGASVDGAEFSITNRSDEAVYVGGVRYEPGQQITTIPTPQGTRDTIVVVGGVAQTNKDALPYGTYEMVEVTPPEGYHLNADWKWTFTIRSEGEMAEPTKIGTSLDDEGVRPADQVIRGGVEMDKRDAEMLEQDGHETEKNNPQGNATFEGAEFTVRNENDQPTWVNDNGTWKLVQPGDDCLTITTDATGHCSTLADALPYGTYSMRETKAPDGYTLTDEVWTFNITEEGVIVSPDDTSDDANKNEDYLDNVPIRGGVQMPKIDSELAEYPGEETKENHAQGDATVSGAEFILINRSKHQVIVGGVIYEPDTQIKTIPDADGSCDDTITTVDGIASTAIDALPYGTYELREKTAPEGYHHSSVNHDDCDESTPENDGESWTFTITKNREYERPAEDDVEHKIDNQIIRGDVEMPKVDTDLIKQDGQEDVTNNAQGDATVVGAVFEIINASIKKQPVIVVDDSGEEQLIPYGEVCCEIVTESDGIARTRGGRLPYGTYQLREKTPPDGYQGTDEVWTFEIREESTTVKPETVDERIDNKIIRGGVEMPKVDTELSQYNVDGNDQRTEENNPQGDATVDGAEFMLINRSKNQVVVGGETYQPGDRIMTIPDANRTDKTYDTIITVDGIAKTTTDALPYGTYELREVVEPDGYHDSGWNHADCDDDEDGNQGESWTFVVRKQGALARPDDEDNSETPEEGVENKIDNQVIRGGVQMPKVDTEFTTLVNGDDTDENFLTDENHPQGDATVDGAEFSITNVSAHHVIVGGKLYEPGERITTIPDGNRGGNLYDVIVTVNGIAKTTTDALPFGTYELREVKAPDGYHDSQLNHEDDETGEVWTFTVREEGVLSRPDDASHAEDVEEGIDNKIDNQVIRGGVEMPKIDTEISKYDGQEDESNPQGDATLDGATFSLTNVSKSDVYVGGQVYAPGERIMTIPDGNADGKISDVITTDADGIARTTNDALPYGTYELREVDEPEGYNHSSFNHKDDDSGEVWTFDVRVEDEMVRPDDERHSESEDDGVENKIDNRIIRGGVRLPKFDAKLVKQPGYEEKENQPTGDATLDGAEFAIDNVSAAHVIVGGKLYEPGERIETIPDANNDGKTANVIVTVDGVAQTTADALPYGTYEIYEVKAPEGYELSEDRFVFTIREEGVIVKPMDDDTTAKIKDNSTTTEVGGNKTDSELNEYSDSHAEQPVVEDSSDDEIDAGDGNETDDGNTNGNDDGNENENDESADVKTLADETNGDENDASTSGDVSGSDSETTGGVTITDPQPTLNDVGIDTNPLTNAQGDATLEGAEFYLINRSKNPVVIGDAVYQPGERILTIPQPDNSYGNVVTSDATGYIDFGDEGLPYGTYELGEETAPQGYNLSDDTWIVEVHGEKNENAVPSDYDEQKATSSSDEVNPQSVDETNEDDVIRGGLSVQKVDKETGRGDRITTGVDDGDTDDADDDENITDGTDDGSDDTDTDSDAADGEEQEASARSGESDTSTDDADTDGSLAPGDDVENDGSNGSGDADSVEDIAKFHNASLAGTMFEIRNASDKAVIVDGKLYQVGQVVKTITTDANGYAETAADALPYGTYDVYEVGAPNGYISSADSYGNSDGIDDDNEKAYVQTVEIREEGVIVPCARPFANQIKRGDITFQKIDDDGNVMPHVAFRVTSKTTGESHIIVTDENGVYDSSSAVIPHSQNTNANDDAFDADGNIDDDALVHDAGTWFYGNKDGKPFYDDEAQTLPNNADRFNPAENVNTDVDNDTSDDIASDDESDAGVDDGNDDAQGDTDGSDEQDDTSSDVEIMANDDALADGDGNLVLGDDVEGGSGSNAGSSSEPVHVSPVYEVTGEDGTPQQVTIGYVETDVNGSFTNNSVVFNSDGSITIVYDKTLVDMNTGERRSYTSYETYADGSWKIIVVGSDMLDGTNADGITDADGNGEFDIVDNPDAYTTSAQYPMRSVDDNLGAFPYDQYIFEELPSKATYGHNLVAFEATVQRHNYLLNLGPITDNVIDIHTTATDQSDGDHIFTTDGTVTIVDTVEYTNLNTDREYTMTGTLMDYETGEPMKDADGNAITSSVTFQPDSPNGSVDVVFEIDASQLGGVQTVVFEDLYWNNIHIASHADIEDTWQRVEFRPEIGTTATADSTNDHFAYADGSVIITDTVHYKGVVPCREFIVHGILMDKNTGDALVDSNGETVENSAVFTPETSEGDVEVRFEFDATDLAGLDVVVFEDLYRIDAVTNRQPDENDDSDDVPATQRLVASHNDINDDGQTVNIRANDLASDQIASDLVQTGTMIGAGLIAAAVVGGVTYAIVRRNRSRKTIA